MWRLMNKKYDVLIRCCSHFQEGSSNFVRSSASVPYKSPLHCLDRAMWKGGGCIFHGRLIKEIPYSVTGCERGFWVRNTMLFSVKFLFACTYLRHWEKKCLTVFGVHRPPFKCRPCTYFGLSDGRVVPSGEQGGMHVLKRPAKIGGSEYVFEGAVDEI